jgi:bifunctional DNA-binding transcriptional regulator/antitoxin component of YhaV-PrlF toxin-antitoxin module
VRDLKSEVVKITKKGQATIPKDLRVKHGFKDRAIVVDTDEGVLFKPFPDISEEKGSLKTLFLGRTSKEIIKETRKEDKRKERRLELR